MRTIPAGGQVTQTVVRFVIGGSLVAAIPLVSQRAGAAAAGVLLLFPVVSLVGLLFLGVAEGMPAVARASSAAIVGLPTVVAFLVTVSALARNGRSLSTCLGAGVVAWLLTALPIARFTRRRNP
jgi:uncharacterized membrane protein (GlpM family)